MAGLTKKNRHRVFTACGAAARCLSYRVTVSQVAALIASQVTTKDPRIGPLNALSLELLNEAADKIIAGIQEDEEDDCPF